MKVITGVEEYTPQESDILVFLAGGITDCPNWQKEVIAEIRNIERTNNLDDLVIFNPRRENFPIHDPDASQEQIEWEFKWLEKMDIFSMYLSRSESVQPICLYELGRNIVKMQNRFPGSWKSRIIITAEDGYKRMIDVIFQTALATEEEIAVRVPREGYEPERHAEEIVWAYTRVKERKK